MGIVDKLTVIIGNPGKAEQLSKYLRFSVNFLDIDLPEIQFLDLHEVVRVKVEDAYKIVKSPVLVDDVSLSIDSLGRLPGPFIRYFLKEIGTEGVCRIASLSADRSATAEVAIAYCDGKETKIFSGKLKGRISEAPKGEGGFGWDETFVPEGYDITRSEMDETNYDITSPRKFALEKLREFLKKK